MKTYVVTIRATAAMIGREDPFNIEIPLDVCGADWSEARDKLRQAFQVLLTPPSAVAQPETRETWTPLHEELRVAKASHEERKATANRLAREAQDATKALKSLLPDDNDVKYAGDLAAVVTAIVAWGKKSREVIDARGLDIVQLRNEVERLRGRVLALIGAIDGTPSEDYSNERAVMACYIAKRTRSDAIAWGEDLARLLEEVRTLKRAGTGGK
jgi:hypothetical protein